MKKFHFNHAIINIVVGVLLIAFAVVGMFVFDWFSETATIFVGVLIILFNILYFVFYRPNYKNSNALMILTAEVVIAITLAVLLITGQLALGFVLGFVLYMRGLVYLLILQLLQLRKRFITFIIYMVVLTLGAYVFFGNPPIQSWIEWIIFAVFAIYGIMLLVFGIDLVKKKKS